MTIESLIIASAIVLVIGVGIFIMALEKTCKEEDSAFDKEEDSDKASIQKPCEYCPNCGRRLEEDEQENT